MQELNVSEFNDVDKGPRPTDELFHFTENKTINAISDKSIRVLTNTDRNVFTIIFACILVSSLLLNIGATWTTIKRNYRFIQKTCIIALALSDMVTVITFSINNLEMFSHPYINWTMGSFMCHLIPMCQSFGVLSSSLALLMIAMDRYRNIVKALNKRWDPRKLYCIFGVVAGWILCAGMSVPMFIFYSNEMVLVIFLDDHGNIPKNYTTEKLFMCAATDKEPLRKSYLILVVFVFAPLLFVFFWFYFKIAQLIWRHRKPVEITTEDKTNISVTESSMVITSDIAKNHVKNVQKKLKNKNKNEQIKKKIRTFKVIIVLIANFIVCRLPFWIFTLIKLSYPVTGLTLWRLNCFISALNVFNTILNPLFYTYLNITLTSLRRIRKEVNAFLCCFFSDEEFVEFEKGKSIFANDKTNENLHKNCNVYGKKYNHDKLSESKTSQKTFIN